MLHYDVVVVGSGPAGERGAAQAAALGRRVAIVEKEAVPGGTCVNTGTIPSKALRETALAIQQARGRGAFGLELRLSGAVTIPQLMGRRDVVTAHEHQRIRSNLSSLGVEMFRGTASFLAPHRVLVTPTDRGQTELEADVVLLATGTRPAHPSTIPLDHQRIYDSDSILMLDHVPRSLAVLGAGVAGCEYASIFAALGVHVSLVDSRDRVLPFLDAELSNALEDLMATSGVDVFHRLRAQRVEPGERDVLVYLSDGSRLVAEKVLVAAGRVGNVEGLNLDAAGLRSDERGFLKVNEFYQTEVPHVYAAGDLVGFPGLASTSMEQGRVAMLHACGEAKHRMTDLLPVGIYTIPEISGVGETEESLREKRIPFVAGKCQLADNARANLVGEPVGFLKLLAASDGGRILGVHSIGPHASELVHLGAAVMAFDGTLDYFVQAVFNYPTLGDAYKDAAYEALAGMKGAKVTRIDRAASDKA
ncbi:MAG TPA: Si-specific NAD(P)(+) transhydrogenase [Anaeromyxobacteraceae bacterium]|nr:Si-specific NAD(P)(+) transhydrogenase [Anaeromyxobacteraceae bacterium]